VPCAWWADRVNETALICFYLLIIYVYSIAICAVCRDFLGGNFASEPIARKTMYVEIKREGLIIKMQ